MIQDKIINRRKAECSCIIHCCRDWLYLFQRFLLTNQKFAVRIDVGLLRRPDAMLVEHLLCAARTWRDHGLSFEVTNLTKANEVIFMSLGLKNHLNWRAVA